MAVKTYLFNLLLKFKNLHKKIFVKNWPEFNWTTDSFIKKLETNTFLSYKSYLKINFKHCLENVYATRPSKSE